MDNTGLTVWKNWFFCFEFCQKLMSAPASWAKVSANTAHANQQRGPQDYYPNQRMQNTLNTNINNNFNGFPGIIN